MESAEPAEPTTSQTSRAFRVNRVNRWWNPGHMLDMFVLSPIMARRGLAMLVDFALISALQFGLGQVFGVNGGWIGSDGAVINGDGWSFAASRFASIPYIWLVVIVVAYFTFFETLFGATPGKGLLRLRVLTLDGHHPSPLALLLRNILRLVDTLPFLYIVGGLVAQNTPYEQRVGDIVAQTCVVPSERLSADLRRARLLPLKIALLCVTLAALVGAAGVFEYEGRGPLVIQSWLNLNNNAASVAPTCGAFRPWPFPDSPGGDTFRFETPGSVMEYAIGAPQWGNGVVNYPIRMHMWNNAHDTGFWSGQAMQVPEAVLHDEPDVYSGSVTLRWEGPLAGGWVMTGGQLTC